MEWERQMAYKYREGHQDGLAEGRAEGKKAGILEGSQQKAIEAALILVKEFNIEPEIAAKKMNAPLEKVLQLLK